MNQNSKERSAGVEGSAGVSLRTQEHLSVKRSLPKSSVSRAILHENRSHDRQLQVIIGSLDHRKQKYESMALQSQTAFYNRQRRKEEKWRKEDANRLQKMNFPSVKSNTVEKRPDSMVIIYRTPRYALTVNNHVEEMPESVSALLLPITAITPEKTEIMMHKDKTFITKIPRVMKVDESRLEKYNMYCGTRYMKQNLPREEGRFNGLTQTLTDLPRRFEVVPVFHIDRQSRTESRLRSRRPSARQDGSASSEPVDTVNDAQTQLLRRLNLKRESLFPMMEKLTGRVGSSRSRGQDSIPKSRDAERRNSEPCQQIPQTKTRRKGVVMFAPFTEFGH